VTLICWLQARQNSVDASRVCGGKLTEAVDTRIRGGQLGIRDSSPDLCHFVTRAADERRSRVDDGCASDFYRELSSIDGQLCNKFPQYLIQTRKSRYVLCMLADQYFVFRPISLSSWNSMSPV